MRSRFPLVALAVAAALPSLASAVDFSYSGFSTAGYAQSDTDDASVGYAAQPGGIDSSGDVTTDSKIGVQVSARFNDLISATVQGVAYADMTGDWEPHLDWAYLRLQAMRNLSFRAGYLRAPTFMYSDSVFVGYANVWVRPPLEVYNLSPVYQMRGFDATWRTTVGPVQLTLNPYYGDGEVDIPNGTIDVPSWAGLAATAEYNSFQVRAGYSEVKLGYDQESQLAPVINALRAIPSSFCGACSTLSSRLDIDGTIIHNLNIGAQFDDGKNFVAAEIGQSRTDNYLIVAKTGAYATYGRRFGNIMPYATYAQLRRDTETHSDAIPAVGPLAPLSLAVNGVLAAGAGDQDSYSVGVRYELPAFSVLKGSLVKLQLDHIDTKDTNGMLNAVQPGFDGTLNMLSASFDFIF
jgi:hypothetical protein